MRDIKQWVIVDWAGNRVNTGEETFDSFDDAWTWIDVFVDESEHEEMYVVCEDDLND